MKIDIVTILYHSQSWIKGYLDSVEQSQYELGNINLILINNDPADDYSYILNNHPLIHKLGSFQYQNATENLGFGKGNNLGAALGNAPYVFFLNIDTEIIPDAFSNLESYIQQSTPDVGAWEFRQFPYEHPKVYDPVTQYTSWASAAALVIRRSVFEEVNGFDSRLFMYAEDVDISWHIRRCGYYIRYCPKCVVNHYTYEDADTVKPTQFYYSIYNNLLLRYKYGSIRQIISGYKLIHQVVNSANPVFPDQKERLKEMLKNAFSIGMQFRRNSFKKPAKPGFSPTFQGFDYENNRKGAFFKNRPWQSFASLPLVSVIVRTHKRPLVLQNAIRSLLNQTYPNVEIVIVEDGQNTAQKVVEQFMPLGKIQYHYTGINKGRSHAGNLGMSMATGSLLCFLDDDDMVYADHVETLVGELLSENYNMVHAPAFCVTTDTQSIDPYIYTETRYEVKHDYPADKEELLNNNLFPIQSVLFEKRLFDELGGFDETIDYLEDWALWLKYAQNSSIGYADKLTSLYRVPANAKQYKTRLSQLLSTREYVLSTYTHNYIQQKNDMAVAIDHLKHLKPMDSKITKTHVDLLIYGFNCLSINGWAVVHKKDSFDNIYLKVVINEQTYYFKLANDRRRDIQRKFNSKNKFLGFKGDLQILGINGSVIPISLVFVKGEAFIEQYINWFSFLKIRYMAQLRRYLRTII